MLLAHGAECAVSLHYFIVDAKCECLVRKQATDNNRATSPRRATPTCAKWTTELDGKVASEVNMD